MAVQNQTVRIVKLCWERFGYFFSKPNHSSAPAVHSARTNTFACLIERARLQSFIVIGTSPLSQSVHSGEWEKAVSSEPRTSTQVCDCRGLSVTTQNSSKQANEEVLHKTLGVLCLSPPVTTCVRAVLRKNEFEASYLFFCIYSGLGHF